MSITCELLYISLAVLGLWMLNEFAKDQRKYDQLEKLLEENNGNSVQVDGSRTGEQ